MKYVRGGEHWHTLLRGVVESPSLEIFGTGLGTLLWLLQLG